MITLKVTSRGRVTIPTEIRERLGLIPGSLVRLTIQEGSLVIQRAEPELLLLRGSVKPRQRPEDFEAVRRKVRKTVARRRVRHTGE